MTDIQPIVLLASWGSGSTAVTGFLHHCGAHTCPPHQLTNDDRTPSSYEPFLYASALRKLFDQTTLQQTGEFQEFRQFFEEWWTAECQRAQAAGLRSIALKHPLQVFTLPFLQARLKPKYVVVTRPFEDIERTRQRRQWPPIAGAEGARQIYSTALSFLIEHSCPFLSVPYNALLGSPIVRQSLLDFCNLRPDRDRLETAEQFLLFR